MDLGNQTESSWLDRITRIEALEDAEFDAALVAEMQAKAHLSRDRVIKFSTPTFKEYETSEVKGCGKNSFPAFSITGGACALDCDHCQAKILEPMIPALHAEDLDTKVRELIRTQGLQGFLLSGGSNRRNEIRYDRFYPVIEELKCDFPDLKIAIHTALTDEKNAKRMEEAGVDTAMMDVIGAQETIRDVYHLDRPVEDFEATLAALTATSMEISPHIVIGLHYGRTLGEQTALEMVSRYPTKSLILVVIMPFYSRPGTFTQPDTSEVGRIFLQARETLGDRDVLLGCARPAGMHKRVTDAYAVMAGLDGIAFPAEGALGVAALTGPQVAPGTRLLLDQDRRQAARPDTNLGPRRVSGEIDILVVGLGPAGASAAAAAARAGARVLAVDRRAHPGQPVQCAEFVPSLLGADTGAVKSAALQEIAAMDTFLAGQTEHTPDFRGVMIDRAAFDAALVAEAQSAGATIRPATLLPRHRRRWRRDLGLGAPLRPASSSAPTARAPPSVAAPACRNLSLVEARQITVPLLTPHTATDIFLAPEIEGGYGWLFPRGAEANLGLGVVPEAKADLKPLLESLRQQLIAEGRIGETTRRLTGGAIPVGGITGLSGRIGTTPSCSPATPPASPTRSPVPGSTPRSSRAASPAPPPPASPPASRKPPKITPKRWKTSSRPRSPSRSPAGPSCSPITTGARPVRPRPAPRLDRLRRILAAHTVERRGSRMTCLKPEGAIPGANGPDGRDFNPFDIMQPRAPGQVPVTHKNGRPVQATPTSPPTGSTAPTTGS